MPNALTLLRRRIADLLEALPLSAAELGLSPRHFARGTMLLEAGAPCDRAFWLQSGVARRYIVHQGRELTLELYLADDVATSVQGYILQQPSTEWIEVLAPTQALVITHAYWAQLTQQVPQLVTLDQLMLEHYTCWLEQRYLELRTLSAAERYAQLLDREPQLLQHVALSHIASYLGVSLETLSRIRAERA